VFFSSHSIQIIIKILPRLDKEPHVYIVKIILMGYFEIKEIGW